MATPCPAFRHRQQRVRRAAFEDDVGLEPGETAGRVEGPADTKPASSSSSGWRARRPISIVPPAAEKRRDGKRPAARPLPTDGCKALVAGLNRMKQILPEMNLAALEHCQSLGPDRLDQLHLHVGIALRVAVQETRQDAFDELRRGRHLQHPGVSAPEQLRPLADARWRSSTDRGNRRATARPRRSARGGVRRDRTA